MESYDANSISIWKTFSTYELILLHFIIIFLKLLYILNIIKTKLLLSKNMCFFVNIKGENIGLGDILSKSISYPFSDLTIPDGGYWHSYF